ncbi:MAG: dihydroorotase [Pseudomonadota bacterium]
MSDSIILRRFYDMHVHFRKDAMLAEVLPFSARYCGRAVAMPNTRPRAILNGYDAREYAQEMWAVLDVMQYPEFEPLLTIEIRDTTTPRMIAEARHAGVIAGKVYPRGLTTNSEHGLWDFTSDNIFRVFRKMEDVGMLLLLHGELDQERTLVTKREQAFLPMLAVLASEFPDLRIVLEHVSSRSGIEMVEMLGKNVAATITAHHLCLTLNDVIGDGLRPHHGCMPMPKDFDDRDALIEAATGGNPKFFFGSDSAPHTRENKECAKGACGVFTAPIVPELLAEIFERAGKLERLEDFTSTFGEKFYGLPFNAGTIHLVKQDWIVPTQYGEIVPFKAGETLRWKMVE